jgi:hypothetical protein
MDKIPFDRLAEFFTTHLALTRSTPDASLINVLEEEHPLQTQT